MEQEIKPVGEQGTPVETTEATQPPRHPFYDRVKGMHPDKEFASDDDILNAADERMTEHEGYREQNETANKKIIDALYAEPVMANVLDDIGEGADMAEALALHVSPDDLEKALAESDPSKWPEKKAMREANRAAHQSFMDEVNANTAESQKTIQAWSDRRGLDGEAMTEYINELSSLFSDVYKGKITERLLDALYEAKTKPADMAEASEAGEIKGRNANIETITAKESAAKGDGLPGLTSLGTTAQVPTVAPPKHELQDIADFSKKNSI